MQAVFKGKTKDVYQLDNGNYLLKFKDDVTGVDGQFDPGANQVALSIEGIGKADLALSKHFFERLIADGIPTHYIAADLEAGEMEVLPAKVFGQGVEVICRLRAVGSFIRRYGAYINTGDKLSEYVELTLKDDARQDPLITKEGLEALGIMTADEYTEILELTKKITRLLSSYLAEKDLELYDIKYEFGRTEDGKIILIDELSGGNMRVFKASEPVEPMELSRIICE
ncbi:MAG: phosphoribosylaminoimidazolesuccinocarboxamide synthase [Eubacteriales bacterium]|nr:phosphoribosylaminoimidazolesuccinocarboxamide synthase [Eubacteriales bacterium]